MMKESCTPTLEVSQLSVSYGKTPVLWDLSLKVPQGVLVGILGPNGAGKSTFIKAALNLIKPLTGKIEFFGLALQKVQKKIAYVPQKESVDWDFPITVKELVMMGRYGRLGLFKRPREADYVAVEHCLNIVGMSAYQDRQIKQLSGGQQQRAFIARAIVQDADMYFLDEPFTGIDVASEKIIIELLKTLVSKGKTIFVVHHDLNTVESYFDWLILLNMRLIGNGPLKDVFTPEQLRRLYGKSYALFDEAQKRSEEKKLGMVD